MRKNQEILILRNVLMPGGRVADITIANGHIFHTGAAERGDLEIDCSGKTVLPAGTDLHVHMRDGAQKSKETWESGTKSALAGGVTVVVDQPNTFPPLTTPDSIRDRVRLAHDQAYCRFAINGAVTPEADLTGMWKEGVFAFGETFAGPSSYGEPVDSLVLSRTMNLVSSWNGLMTIHAEQVSLGEDNSLSAHDTLRPVQGEAQAVRDILQLNETGCRIHFCHLSSSKAIQMIPPDAATIEVTPHHLFLSPDQFSSDDSHGKVNPPLRSEDVRKELFSCFDRIDIIASDHAPHTIEEKDQSFMLAPSGIPGVETMIPLLMGWVHEKKITILDIIQKTSVRPSEILGIHSTGFSPGDRADFAIYPDEMSIIESENLHSLAGWSPYEGMKAVFPDRVVLAGTVVFDEGEFHKPEFVTNKNYQEPDELVLEQSSSLWLPGRGYSLTHLI